MRSTRTQSRLRRPRVLPNPGTGSARLFALAALLGVVALATLGWWKQDVLRAHRSRSRTPRIVFVSIDTLNLNYTDLHRPGLGLTPQLVELAEGGVTFDRTYTPVSITLPAHAAALTGREPAALGVMVNGDRLDETVETLPEVLNAAGYRTGAIVSLGVLKRNFGIGQGFERYDDTIEEEHSRWYRYADEVVDRGLAWVDARGDEPFFVWLHLSDPHEPYRIRTAGPDVSITLDGVEIGDYALADKERQKLRLDLAPGIHRVRWSPLREPRSDDRPATALVLELLDPESYRDLADVASIPPEIFLRDPWELELTVEGEAPVELELYFRGRINDPPTAAVLDAYRAEVAYVDEQLSRLRAGFTARGLDDGTLWVVVSDHGEGLGHHGILGHATYTHEDHMRALFVLNGPGVPAAQRIADPLVSLSDVAPTVLDLLGLRGLGGEGVSRVDCWSGGGCDGREEYWVYGASVDRNRVTAVAGYRGRHKLLWQRNRRLAIHDLVADPDEHTNLADPYREKTLPTPPEVRELGDRFDDQRELFQTLLDSRGQARSPQHEEMLKSLGYL